MVWYVRHSPTWWLGGWTKYHIKSAFFGHGWPLNEPIKRYRWIRYVGFGGYVRYFGGYSFVNDIVIGLSESPMVRDINPAMPPVHQLPMAGSVLILRFGNFHVGLGQSETGFGEHSAS